MAAGGMVLTTATGEKAVFLETQDAAALQLSVDLVLQRPTVAGSPLDIDAFQRLGRALELAETTTTSIGSAMDPIVLSIPESDALNLLQQQAVVRAALPQRLRYSCIACGQSRIVNPAVQAAAQTSAANSAAEEQRAGRFMAMGTAADLLISGGAFIATLSLLSAYDGRSTRSGVSQAPTCERCQGNEFDMTPLTYCPGCRVERDETVLLTCPDCRLDFVTRVHLPPFWCSPQEAADSFGLSSVRGTFAGRVDEFENGLYPDQRTALDGALTRDDRLVAMFRCRFPGQAMRSVAVILTSHALLWARQSLLSSATAGRVDWSEVSRLQATGQNEADEPNRGLEITTNAGSSIRLIDFRRAGVSLDGEDRTFDRRRVYQLVSQLLMVRNPRADVSQWHEPVAPPQLRSAPEPPRQLQSAAQSPPPRPRAPQDPPQIRPPMPGPRPPSWYPDPWRQAAFRWWDGGRWTPHTR